MTVTATPVYGTSTAITWTMNSLASDTNLLVGRASTAVDNTSDLAVDSLVGGSMRVGGTPSASVIQIWAYASFDGTNYNAGATGTDAGLTVTSSTKLLMRLLTMLAVDTTANATYIWGPFSVAQAFGGTMPRKWGLFAVQNSGGALNAANNSAAYTPVKYQSA